jgi:hypothetical protein
VREAGHEPKNSPGRDGGGDAAEEEDLASTAVVETLSKNEKKTEPPPCLDADAATHAWPPSSSPSSRAGVAFVASSGGGLRRLERGWGWVAFIIAAR